MAAMLSRACNACDRSSICPSDVVQEKSGASIRRTALPSVLARADRKAWSTARAESASVPAACAEENMNPAPTARANERTNRAERQIVLSDPGLERALVVPNLVMIV